MDEDLGGAGVWEPEAIRMLPMKEGQSENGMEGKSGRREERDEGGCEERGARGEEGDVGRWEGKRVGGEGEEGEGKALSSSSKKATSKGDDRGIGDSVLGGGKRRLFVGGKGNDDHEEDRVDENDDVASAAVVKETIGDGASPTPLRDTEWRRSQSTPQKSKRRIYDDGYGVVSNRRRASGEDDGENVDDVEEYEPGLCVAGGWSVAAVALITCGASFYFMAAMPLLFAPAPHILIAVAVFGAVGVFFGLSYTQPGVAVRRRIHRRFIAPRCKNQKKPSSERLIRRDATQLPDDGVIVGGSCGSGGGGNDGDAGAVTAPKRNPTTPTPLVVRREFKEEDEEKKEEEKEGTKLENVEMERVAREEPGVGVEASSSPAPALIDAAGFENDDDSEGTLDESFCGSTVDSDEFENADWKMGDMEAYESTSPLLQSEDLVESKGKSKGSLQSASMGFQTPTFAAVEVDDLSPSKARKRETVIANTKRLPNPLQNDLPSNFRPRSPTNAFMPASSFSMTSSSSIASITAVPKYQQPQLQQQQLERHSQQQQSRHEQPEEARDTSPPLSPSRLSFTEKPLPFDPPRLIHSVIPPPSASSSTSSLPTTTGAFTPSASARDVASAFPLATDGDAASPSASTCTALSVLQKEKMGTSTEELGSHGGSEEEIVLDRKEVEEREAEEDRAWEKEVRKAIPRAPITTPQGAGDQGPASVEDGGMEEATSSLTGEWEEKKLGEREQEVREEQKLGEGEEEEGEPKKLAEREEEHEEMEETSSMSEWDDEEFEFVQGTGSVIDL